MESREATPAAQQELNAPVAATLESLAFDNTYARLPEAFYARVAPTPLPDPCLISFNADAAALIGLDPTEAERPEFVDYFAGHRLLPGSEPVAACYAGHQFGVWVPQLGDGRAILLGEVAGPAGRWELHLKGAGCTPFSRSADGRAVLRSSIREYLCSEAMHALGIPTTRAMCLIGSSEPVWREARETAAAVLRLAPSFVRFGSFEVFFRCGRYDLTAQLVDYIIRYHLPELASAPRPAAALLREAVDRTARLFAAWQAVGFCHGVLNTDNMSILGLTLDYGPFGFLDGYEPGHICNHSDDFGRYAFNRQPGIGWWNLRCLAQALMPHLTQEEALAALEAYQPALEAEYLRLMRAKLGLAAAEDDDARLITDWLALMAGSGADYTATFRALSRIALSAEAHDAALRDQFIDRAAFDAWLTRYRSRLAREDNQDAERQARMNHANPLYILRNHLAETAIRKAADEQDYSEVNRLLELLRHPFDEQPGMADYAAPPPDWARGLELSCSS